MNMFTPYIPYAVVLAVIIVFFFICYALFKAPKEKAKPTVTEVVHNRHYYEPKKVDYGAEFQKRAEGEMASAELEKAALREEEPQPVWEETTVLNAVDVKHAKGHTAPMKSLDMTVSMEVVKPQHLQELGEAEDAADATRMMPRVEESMLDDRTQVMTPIRVETVETPYPVATAPVMTEPLEGEEELVKRAVSQYVAAYGLLNPKSNVLVEEMTAYAFRYVGITSVTHWESLLSNVVVQEAILAMQKAYVANPTSWMRDMLAEAFKDVVEQPKSSTHHLVAFDALKIMVHLELGHLQALAIALLLQYSRNSNNFTVTNFRRYVTRELEPFLSDLPKENSVYKQLEYLHCVALEPERVTLPELFSNSYPLVFNYRGFSQDELIMLLGDFVLKENITVESMNSSLLKLAVADETMVGPLFRRAGILDEQKQVQIMNLAHSKPSAFGGAESETLFKRISPSLAALNDIYNHSLLSQMSLTLLGLYLGRAHVKAIVGKEFDLSPWLG